MAVQVWYHKNCSDGFCAAWVAHKALNVKGADVNLVPVQYGDPPPPHAKGDEVYVVDFSFKADVLRDVARVVDTLVVIDHHETAMGDLLDSQFPENVRVSFDLEHSGAALAWRYFFPNEPTPQLVRYVEDSDLWRWNLPQSRQVNAWLGSLPYDLERWSDADRLLRQGHAAASGFGEIILGYQEKLVQEHLERAYETSLFGYSVLAVNCSVKTLVSAVCERLAAHRAFGASWFQRPDGTVEWSLRSREGGVNVGELAKLVGGGGHEQAAGFEMKGVQP